LRKNAEPVSIPGRLARRLDERPLGVGSSKETDNACDGVREGQ
jgi:hypothetical protein